MDHGSSSIQVTMSSWAAASSNLKTSHDSPVSIHSPQQTLSCWSWGCPQGLSWEDSEPSPLRQDVCWHQPAD